MSGHDLTFAFWCGVASALVWLVWAWASGRLR